MKYTVYCDDVQIFAPESDKLTLINPVLNLCLNDAGEFTFTVPLDHPHKDILKAMISTITVYRVTDDDEEMVFTGRIIEPKELLNGTVQYKCEGALAYLNDSCQPQAEYHDISPGGYLEVLLEQHNKQVPENRQIKRGAVTVTDPNDSLYRYTNYNSTLEEIKEDILDDLGGYCRIRQARDGLYLDILKEYGIRNSQTIEFQKNLFDFSGTGTYTDLCTVIIPLGAKIEDISETEQENNKNDALDKYTTIAEVNDGYDYLVNRTLYDKYGGIWKVVHWDNVHTPAMLKKRAQQWLIDEQFERLVIDAKAFDESYVNGNIEAFNLGDEIRVISEPHGIDRWMLLSNMTISLDSPSQNTITLGGTGKPITLSSITNDIQVETNELDDRIVIPNKLIQQAINQATQLINSMTHGYVVVEPNEILIMDTPDKETATNLWRWNMGGLGFSHNGYEGPFETAITMDGTIVGKFLAANSIAAEKIDVNYRTEVERNIQLSEENANFYTDSKLKGYYTKSQVEVQLQTTADSILLSAQETAEVYTDRKLGDYYTKAEIKIQTDNILSQVTQKLSNYSTTVQMNSAINQKANEISASVSKTYATKTALGNLETTVESVEAKVTEKGIFATINSGIKGSQTITNTKFSLTKSGITIQGGGITIKNNTGTSVFYADTSGNLTLRGDIVHYGSGSYKAVSITDHQVQIYAWNQSGNYLGSLGALKSTTSTTPYIALFSDYGDNLVLGTKQGPSSNLINTIIELGSYGGTAGIKYISGTINGTIDTGCYNVTINNGLITAASRINNFNGDIYFGDSTINVSNGIIKSMNNTRLTAGTYYAGNGHLTFSHGMLTDATGFGGATGRIGWGGGYIQVNHGMITAYHISGAGGSLTVQTPSGWKTLSLSYGIISQVS